MLNAPQTGARLTLRDVQERLADAGLMIRHPHASGDPARAVFASGKVSLGGRKFNERTGEHNEFVVYLMSRSVSAAEVGSLFDDAANVHVSDVHGGPIRPFAA